MDLRGKRFVVIGGAGLIGSHAVESLLLEEPASVVIYDNFVRGSHENLERVLDDPRVSIFPDGGDITQADILNAALEGADGVFHFAALWLLQCYEYPRTAFDVNVRGTFNVIEACVAHDVQRLVFSSSASVYGDAIEEPMTEDHPFNFANFYGATKVAGEAMLRSFHGRYGLDYVGLRYMNVYGPRQDYQGAYIAVIMKMLDALDRDEPLVIYGDGSQAYDFVYVGDCGRANVLAMKADATDRFYNVGRGVRTSIKELAETLLRVTGSDVGIRYEPAGLTFVKNRIGSTERAAAEIGFSAEVDLDEGLQRLIDWRSAHKEGVARRRAQVGLIP
ncbi:MAG TPA: NAD-dependent epimerase/dehydratase family protein [Solirubrobacteraceae bacterium]|jgi:UDP-glucose 4-epimerase|nr:NAD-dependent epimerase/dehydratase family protein [Solirubrobacteraceae bacterium]